MALHEHNDEGTSHLPIKKKVGKILRDGKIRGKKLTKRQKGLFGVIRGGKRPTRLSQMAKKSRS